MAEGQSFRCPFGGGHEVIGLVLDEPSVNANGDIALVQFDTPFLNMMNN